jgi:hypothetical protein
MAKVRAFIRPAYPTMDYVPQNFGIYDTYFDNFKEPECRYCHGASTSERHHSTIYASGESCMCHYNGAFENPIRDCRVCHVDYGPIGSFGNPHHKSDLAGSGQCNACHLYVVEVDSVEPPSYAPGITTPTPYSCENCHWPSGKKPDQASTYEGGTTGKAKFLSDWKNWFGLPKPTYWPDGLAHPKPIEADGLFSTGTLLQGKPYKPLNGTHHAVAGAVYPRCYFCHSYGYGQTCSWDANNPYLIRYCENCHSVDAIHGFLEHVTTNNVYTVGGNRNQTVTADQKCVACHGDSLPYLPPLPPEMPEISFIEPDFGSSGISVNIIPATETCFIQDPVEGLCSFGQKMTGDTVQMRQAGQGNRWIDVPVNSWSEHLIQVMVPAGTFLPGRTYLRVSKQGVGNSILKAFTLKKDPLIYSLTPDAGSWGTVIGISGEGFGLKKEKIYDNGYGYSTYVELYSSGQRYRVTQYNVKGSTYQSWNDDGISINIAELVDVNTGNEVSAHDLYLGCWDLRVVTDYFKDDGDRIYNENGHLDIKNSGNPVDLPNASGSGDELLSRAVSDSVCFTVVDPPYISGISPNPVVSQGTVTLYGSDFGATRGTRIIKLWNKNHTRSSVVKNAKIFSWSDTEIKFQAPANNSLTGKPKIKDVQIVVNPGAPEETGSNFYSLTILVVP